MLVRTIQDLAYLSPDDANHGPTASFDRLMHTLLGIYMYASHILPIARI